MKAVYSPHAQSHKLLRIRRMKGFSIVQVMVAAAMVGGLSLLITKLSKSMLFQSNHSREAATLTALKNEGPPILKDIPTWLARMRSSNSDLNTCIPASGAPTSCPNGTISDASVQAAFPGLKVVSMNLVDFLGSPLAGSESNPLYLDSYGATCTANNCRRFQVIGYFARQNATGNPGAIEFAYKIDSLRTNTESFQFRSELVRIPIGLNWTALSAQCPPVGQPSKTLFIGINADRSPICQAPPPGPSIPNSCPANNVLVPNGSGGVTCAPVPMPAMPAVPSLPWSCAANEVLKSNGSGGAICARPQISCRQLTSGLDGAPAIFCDASQGEFATGGGFSSKNLSNGYSCPGGTMDPTTGNAYPHDFGPTNDGLGVFANFFGYGGTPLVGGDTCGKVTVICCKAITP